VDEKYHEQASDLEAHRRQFALEEVRRRMQGAGRDDCEDCGELIPRERRLAAPAAIRCIACQELYERMST